MGSLFSKSKSGNKVAPDGALARPLHSAPSRLEGLDGTSLPPIGANRRAITPNTDYPGEVDSGEPKKGGPKKVDVIGKQTDGSQLAAALPSAAAPLPEEFKTWTQVFEERVVRSLASSQWKDREEGLNAIIRTINAPSFLSAHDTAVSYPIVMAICKQTIKDKVVPVFNVALELLRNVLSVCANTMPAQQLQPPLDSVLPGLVHRCGNLNSKIHEASLQAILNVGSYPRLGIPYLGPFVLAPVPKVAKGANASAHMYGRLTLITHLLANFCTKADSPGLSMEDMLQFAKTGLDMPDEKVRSAAINLVVQIYHLRRQEGLDLEAERYLGPVKPALLQILERRFAEAASEIGVSGRGSKSMAAATGVSIKVGKQLPPLAAPQGRPGLAPLGSLKSNRPGTSSGRDAECKSPSGMGGRKHLRPQPPASPASAASPKKPFARPGSKAGPPRTPLKDGARPPLQSSWRAGGMLDDEDESLISYISGN